MSDGINGYKPVGYALHHSLRVYIGRFSPFHKGHAEVLHRALLHSDKVLVIIGSAWQPRTIKNPWTAEERMEMIRTWYITERARHPSYSELVIEFQMDRPYNNNKWLSEVQALVADHATDPKDIWITGADRDHTTFYLKQFPTYHLDLVEENERISKLLSATTLRELYFGRKLNQSHVLTDGEVELLIHNFMPETTFSILQMFEKTKAYAKLCSDYHTIKENKAKYGEGPFQTVDNVVVQTGHVLLIKRGDGAMGENLWALPGGFLNSHEWMLDAALRELKEETKIDVPEKVIRNSLRAEETFDYPDRSLRGRTITRTFLFTLPDFINSKDTAVKLPKVLGSDDAKEAKWFSLAEVEDMSEHLFEDHYHIIESMLGRVKEMR